MTPAFFRSGFIVPALHRSNPCRSYAPVPASNLSGSAARGGPTQGSPRRGLAPRGTAAVRRSAAFVPIFAVCNPIGRAPGQVTLARREEDRGHTGNLCSTVAALTGRAERRAQIH